ncbi:MAG: cytochrome c family protein [Deltaproteobacteria bacterium]|nr:cytochrome c family protein [Deltaproteobacteria bacterium]
MLLSPLCLSLFLFISWPLLNGVLNDVRCETSDPSHKRYVGSKACMECHEMEYENFKKFSKKSSSFHSVTIMKKGLTDEEVKACFKCHTTGYGKPGGFTSEEETPHLKNAGCEVCHGPGSIHIESEEAEDIKGQLELKDCETCHNAERVKAFNYKPLIYGGAH